MISQRRLPRFKTSVFITSIFIIALFLVFNRSPTNNVTYTELSEQSSKPSTFLDQDHQIINAALYTYIPDVNNHKPVLKTVSSIEHGFNHNYAYDWIFSYYPIENEEFPDLLKRKIEKMYSGNVIIQPIPTDSPTFQIPENIDTKRLTAALNEKALRASPNANFINYKLKNRFHSYGFQFLPALLNYKYYCNIEVETEIMCDIELDFFKSAVDNNKKYGFVNAPADNQQSTTSLFSHYKAFLNSVESSKDSASLLRFIYDEDLKQYTNCNFDSNFEIADLDFFRSMEYKSFFEYMDIQNGFFYERWTDYNIKTLAVMTFLSSDDVFWLDNTGFFDSLDRLVCPYSFQSKLEHKCHCENDRDYSFTKYSCLPRYFNVMNLELPKDSPKLLDKYVKIPKYKKMRIRNSNDKPFEKIFSLNNRLFVEKFL